VGKSTFCMWLALRYANRSCKDENCSGESPCMCKFDHVVYLDAVNFEGASDIQSVLSKQELDFLAPILNDLGSSEACSKVLFLVDGLENVIRSESCGSSLLMKLIKSSVFKQSTVLVASRILST
jgi:hypothetical protein